MAESSEISTEDFRVLVERAGLNLTAEELESLKPMYESYARQAAFLRELELASEDLAVAFSPAGTPITQVPR